MFRRQIFTFAVDKEKGVEFYREIFELGLPTLEVPRRPCTQFL